MMQDKPQFGVDEVVRLRSDLASMKLSAGARGTVLLVYNEPPMPISYEVEFLDKHGEGIAIITLDQRQLEKE